MSKAVGIPSRENYGNTSDIPVNQLLTYIDQLHKARRAGKHHDIRFGDKELFSWATRKGLPEPGQKRMLFQQPIHSKEYADFEGEIPEGYGAGTVSKSDKGTVLVTEATPNKIKFVLAHKKYPEYYTMIRQEGDNKPWLMINHTPTSPEQVLGNKDLFSKVHIKSVPADKAEEFLSGVVEGKVDGASGLFKLKKDSIDVLSYRIGTNGRPIVHTERFFGGKAPTVDVPKKWQNKVLRGEIYGVDKDNQPLSSQEVTPLLNMSLAKSIQNQQDTKTKLRGALFGVAGENLNTPTRESELKEVLSFLPPQYFNRPPVAHGSEEAMKLWKEVEEGKHPEISEGVVVYPESGDAPLKIKLRPEYDVQVSGVFPGEGKYTGSAGGIEYKVPEGVGRVGTGFDDDFRKWLWENKDSLEGRIARITSTKKLPSGKYFQPSFMGLHEDYPTKKANDMSFLPKEVKYNGSNINTPSAGVKTFRNEVNRWYDNAGGFNNAVDKAQLAQRNRNTSVLGNSKWPKWSPQQLDNKVNVTKGPNWRENFGVYGFYSPSIGSLRSPSIHLSNNSNQAALEHEMSHSVFNPGISNTIKGMAFGANDAHSNKSPNTGLLDSGHKRYISDPGEVDVRLAEIKRRYAKSTGKLVTNPQEAQEAWNWWKQNSNSYPSATNSQNSSDNNSPTMHSSEFEYYDNAPENIKKQYFHRMPELVSNRSNNLNKVSSEDISTSFLPDYTPDQLKEMGVYKEVYGTKDAPRLASLPEWPAHWYNEADPHGWLQWYDRYSKGRRIEDDKRQIKRWLAFKARHGGKAFKGNPTPRRAFALRNWGIDPTKLVDDPESLKTVMDEYKQKQYSKKMEKISFLPKLAQDKANDNMPKIDPTDYDAHDAYLMGGKKMPGSAMPFKDYFSKKNLIESLPWDTKGGLGAALKERGFQNLRDTMDGNIIMTDKDGNLYTWDHELGGIARGHYNLITDRDMDWYEEYEDMNKVSFLSRFRKDKEPDQMKPEEQQWVHDTVSRLNRFSQLSGVPLNKFKGLGEVIYSLDQEQLDNFARNIAKKMKANKGKPLDMSYEITEYGPLKSASDKTTFLPKLAKDNNSSQTNSFLPKTGAIMTPTSRRSADAFYNLADNVSQKKYDPIKGLNTYIQDGSNLMSEKLMGKKMSPTDIVKFVRRSGIASAITGDLDLMKWDPKSQAHYDAFSSGPVSAYSQFLKEKNIDSDSVWRDSSEKLTPSLGDKMAPGFAISKATGRAPWGYAARVKDTASRGADLYEPIGRQTYRDPIKRDMLTGDSIDKVWQTATSLSGPLNPGKTMTDINNELSKYVGTSDHNSIPAEGQNRMYPKFDNYLKWRNPNLHSKKQIIDFDNGMIRVPDAVTSYKPLISAVSFLDDTLYPPPQNMIAKQ